MSNLERPRKPKLTRTGDDLVGKGEFAEKTDSRKRIMAAGGGGRREVRLEC
jgi:hypothetical protein